MKKVRIIINTKKANARKILASTKEMLVNNGFKISKNPDFIIALGGDGTLLHAASIYGKIGIPILGLNIGGLGFLTDVNFVEFSTILRALKAKKCRIEKRMVVKAYFNGHTFYGLNDLIICTRIPGRAVEFSAVINKEYICRFIADGIIVATPTGSTAYSLACGGPILLPHTEAIILTPIAPHTLSVRPLILPANGSVEIEVGKKGKAVMVADGQRNQSVKSGYIVRFSKGEYYVKLLKPPGLTFFGTLREKMKWGGREDA